MVEFDHFKNLFMKPEFTFEAWHFIAFIGSVILLACMLIVPLKLLTEKEIRNEAD